MTLMAESTVTLTLPRAVYDELQHRAHQHQCRLEDEATLTLTAATGAGVVLRRRRRQYPYRCRVLEHTRARASRAISGRGHTVLQDRVKRVAGGVGEEAELLVPQVYLDAQRLERDHPDQGRFAAR